MIKRIFLITGLAAFGGLFSQQTHTVVKGDTPYNISRRYGLSLEDLAALNPSTKDNILKLGEVLVVSTKKNTAATADKTGTIVLQPKQTIYGLTKQYHISEAELRKLNPELDSHMRIGDTVVLPAEAIAKYGGAQTPLADSPNKPEKPVSEVVATSAVDDNSYVVQAKDNYFKLTRKFNRTQQELFAMNPGLEERGLQVGDVIKVKGAAAQTPAGQTATPVVEQTSDATALADDYVTYTVQNGDTVFGILNKFDITLDDLLTLNPNISQGLKTGMVLKIKPVDAAYVKKSGDVLNVVLMLPFGFDTGDSRYRSVSLDFLAGAKLAIARNAAKGQKLDIKVIDAGNEGSFKNSLTQINSDNTDLIIGPLFKSSVLEVLDYVKNTRIPVVAPFANSPELLKYSNLILIETGEEVYIERLASEIKDIYADQKIYIVTDSGKNRANALKTELERRLKNPSVVFVNSAQDIQPEQNLMTGQPAPVIAVLVNDSDDAGESFGKQLIALSQEVPNIKAFSMYYAPIFDKKVDELSRVNLVYLMDRKINTDGAFEKEILADFRKNYCTTPSKYSVIGFDVVNDMLSRENKKGEIFKQINKVQTQLATKFEFRRSKGGAYVNQGYRVVRLVN